MGLREKINQNPAVAGGVTGGVLLLAIVVIVWSVSGGGPDAAAPTKDFYSIDDGNNFFVDEAYPQRIPPFQKDGKTAYKAFVWTCDGGKTKFVSGLLRFNEATKKGVQALVDQKKLDDPRVVQVGESWMGAELKQPKVGDSPEKWIKFEDPRAPLLYAPAKCPTGSGTPEAVQAK